MKINLIIFLLILISLKENKEGKYFIQVENINKKDTIIKIIEKETIDTIFLGDLNNDKIQDTAFVYTPPTLKELDENGNLFIQFGCVDDNCFNKITFSNNFPEIYFKNSVWGKLENIGDLNHDNYNEIIFTPNWFTSCWGTLYIYSYNGKDWNKISNITYRSCNDESLKSHVIKVKNKYYLKGLTTKNGNDKIIKKEIKFK